jgi:hypothetical protein
MKALIVYFVCTGVVTGGGKVPTTPTPGKTVEFNYNYWILYFVMN